MVNFTKVSLAFPENFWGESMNLTGFLGVDDGFRLFFNYDAWPGFRGVNIL
jgi:hypothetical protein